MTTFNTAIGLKKYFRLIKKHAEKYQKFLERKKEEHGESLENEGENQVKPEAEVQIPNLKIVAGNRVLFCLSRICFKPPPM